MKWKSCPNCGNNNWRKIQKEKPIGVSLATRTVTYYHCVECGYEEKA